MFSHCAVFLGFSLFFSVFLCFSPPPPTTTTNHFSCNSLFFDPARILCRFDKLTQKKQSNSQMYGSFSLLQFTRLERFWFLWFYALAVTRGERWCCCCCCYCNYVLLVNVWFSPRHRFLLLATILHYLYYFFFLCRFVELTFNRFLFLVSWSPASKYLIEVLLYICKCLDFEPLQFLITCFFFLS